MSNSSFLFISKSTVLGVCTAREKSSGARNTERERGTGRRGFPSLQALLRFSTVPETLAASNCISPNIPGLLLVKVGIIEYFKESWRSFAFSSGSMILQSLAGGLERLPLVGQKSTGVPVINDP